MCTSKGVKTIYDVWWTLRKWCNRRTVVYTGRLLCLGEFTYKRTARVEEENINMTVLLQARTIDIIIRKGGGIKGILLQPQIHLSSLVSVELQY